MQSLSTLIACLTADYVTVGHYRHYPILRVTHKQTHAHTRTHARCSETRMNTAFGCVN